MIVVHFVVLLCLLHFITVTPSPKPGDKRRFSTLMTPDLHQKSSMKGRSCSVESLKNKLALSQVQKSITPIQTPKKTMSPGKGKLGREQTRKDTPVVRQTQKDAPALGKTPKGTPGQRQKGTPVTKTTQRDTPALAHELKAKAGLKQAVAPILGKRQKGKTGTVIKPKVKKILQKNESDIRQTLKGKSNISKKIKERSGNASRKSLKPMAIMKPSPGKKSSGQASVCYRRLVTNEESDGVREDSESDDGDVECYSDADMDDENNSDFATGESNECSGEESLEEDMDDDDEDDEASKGLSFLLTLIILLLRFANVFVIQMDLSKFIISLATVVPKRFLC